VPTSPTAPAPPKPPRPPTTGPGAAAATAATTALPPTVAAVAIPAAATAALAKAGVAIDAALGALTRFHSRVRLQNEHVIRKTLEKKTPREDVAQVIADEAQLAALFQQRSHERFKARVAAATKEADRAKVKQRVQTAIDAERRYAVQHQEMVAQRAVAAVDRAALRRASPAGAAWLLGPAKTHTPECVAMAGKLWPWQALDYHAFWPPVHGGCACQLMGIDPALKAGHVSSSAVPDPVDAMRAIQVIRDLHTAENADGLELARYRALLASTGALTEEQFDQSIREKLEEALCP
jgi:hypothetical protein